MAYKSVDRCIKNAHEDEKLFVLMARDSTAPLIVMEWVKLNYRTQPIEKIMEAIECAREMARTADMHYQRSHPPGSSLYKACRTCNSNGFTSEMKPCDNCNGLGYEFRPE